MSIILTVVGTIATDPRTITSPGKATFCTFRLASTERKFNPEQKQWIDGETNWVTINAFRSLAAHAGASFAKGERVIVHGRLRVRKWETEEKSGTAVEIEADALGHDLRWGVSSFTKRTASAPEAVGSQETFGEPADDALPHGWAGAAAAAETQQSPDTESDAGAPEIDRDLQ
ncbi:single-stranded DNA-binding protein [Leucobacter sp. USCH14]|uniref:single-stranded DNA-binding protein n=1 Tax=Leucobacter sp. USCH14 TaxID=3024838 RepID=UPI0030AFB43B